MTIVAHAHPFVIGVDTHARTHTLAILTAATGAPTASEQFPATTAGMNRAVAWVARLTEGDLAASRRRRLIGLIDLNHKGYRVIGLW